jgi:beta-glucosidase
LISVILRPDQIRLAAHQLAQADMTFIEKLLRDMTLEEKIGQLTMGNIGGVVHSSNPSDEDLLDDIRAGRLGSLIGIYGKDSTTRLQRVAVEETRLRIPLIFACDVMHGYRTVFPVPLGEAAAFDPDLWERTARVAADETRAAGVTMTFAPMLDVTRDPRWGRIVESPGEDPWLAAMFAGAKVRGFQGADIGRRDAIAATAKHIGAYGAVTGGRDYASVDVSERLLNEVYLPPFRAACEAGVAAIMPSFNDIAGIPTTASAALLRDTVRGRWGFDGVIVSDFNAVPELIKHGVAEDLAQAAALALRAGVDIDMLGSAYLLGLPTALARGDVTIEMIDEAVRRVLTLKAKLGLFDRPFPHAADPAEREAQAIAARALAREAATRSAVLLKNEQGLLPLKPQQRIALIGPVQGGDLLLGGWQAAGNEVKVVTIREALSAALPPGNVSVAKGVDHIGDDVSGVAEAVRIAREADVVVLSIGELEGHTGEAASRAELDLPGRQRALAEAVLDVGKPTVVLLSSGRPLTVPWLIERAQAVMALWFPGIETGNAVADLLLGRANPSGKLAICWPRSVGQIPIFYSERPTGRPFSSADMYTSGYLDIPVAPQFPFGHGLSYSRFEISNIRAGSANFTTADTIAIEADVTNAGGMAGEQTVLLFVRDMVAWPAAPVAELRGITKIQLAPSESGTVRFDLPVPSLAFPGSDLGPEVQAGEFELMVGSSAAPAALLRARIRVGG